MYYLNYATNTTPTKKGRVQGATNHYSSHPATRQNYYNDSLRALLAIKTDGQHTACRLLAYGFAHDFEGVQVNDISIFQPL